MTSSDQIVSVEDLDWSEYEHGERSFRRKRVADAAGGEELGASLYEVDPGNRTWPPHYHTGNEEAMFVLSGEGTLYLEPEGEPHEVSAGDYVALPSREASTHEVEATGDEPLRFLAASTQNEPDVTVFPQREMVGLYAGSAPGGDKEERILSTHLDATAEVPYWDEAESTEDDD